MMLIGTCAQATQFAQASEASTGEIRSSLQASSGAPTPQLTQIANSTLSDLVGVNPAYSHASAAAARVIGAFELTEPAGLHLTAAWSPGFLPVHLSFSDGRCFSLAADYFGTLSNGRLEEIKCDTPHSPIRMLEPEPPKSPHRLRLVGSSWGYNAWADDVVGTTIITASGPKNETLFRTHLATQAIMAMNGPDSAGGDMTLVGRSDNRLIVVTLEVAY
ncbi:MAG: hypothetical protein ACYDD1_13270 [Caulobacteraceae bacterium]